MSENYLEQLVAEWYEYRGYFVKRNVLVGKRKQGGYECELDVVAFNPKTRHLVHIEPSMDSNSWNVREQRYKKKFDAGKKYVPGLFSGLGEHEYFEQIALLVYASKQNHKELGGGKIMIINELLSNIFSEIKDNKIENNAITEHLTILRTLQFVAQYRNELFTDINS
jgi:hypothetical protein